MNLLHWEVFQLQWFLGLPHDYDDQGNADLSPIGTAMTPTSTK